MKKLLLSILSLISVALLHAQTYTAGHMTIAISDTIYHDSASCSIQYAYNYTVTIDSSYIGEVINVIDTATASVWTSATNTTGASPWTATLPIINQGNPDNVYPGYIAFMPLIVNKVVCGADTFRYIAVQDSLPIINPCEYSTVSGSIYIDNNGDCIFDSGDVGLNGLLLNAVDSVTSPSYGTHGWAMGGYSSGGTYSYSMEESWMMFCTVSLPAYYAFIFPSSPCFSTSYTFTPDSLPAIANFPLQCSGNVDVECYALSPARVRLDRPFYIQPVVNNTGCDSASGELTLVLDSRVAYDSALSTYPADTVRGDTLIWNYTNLTSLAAGAYWNSFTSDIYLSLDSTAVVGDTLCFRVYTNIPPTDIDSANNDYTICLPVVYSYDPNEKDVMPAGTGPQGYIPAGPDTLSYNIHFQNTGSDYAQNVVVIDTLDSHINPASLRVIGASFNMTPQWLAPNVVAFNFENIFLPDSSTNEAGSQGAVRFSVALRSGLPAGTQIKNTGYIYFDSNPAVVTNTTLNTIALPVDGINQVKPALPIKISPNPAQDHVLVENLQQGMLYIINMDGATVLQQQVTNAATTIDVSSLSSGIYIIKTVSNDNTTTTKFVKY